MNKLTRVFIGRNSTMESKINRKHYADVAKITSLFTILFLSAYSALQVFHIKEKYVLHVEAARNIRDFFLHPNADEISMLGAIILLTAFFLAILFLILYTIMLHKYERPFINILGFISKITIIGLLMIFRPIIFKGDISLLDTLIYLMNMFVFLLLEFVYKLSLKAFPKEETTI